MSRLLMSAAVPAEAAERLSDVRSIPITRAHLEQAREEMIERLMDGKAVARVDFTGLLDAEIDASPRAVVGELAAHLLAITGYVGDEHSHVENRTALRTWMEGLVEKFVNSREDLIIGLAEELAASEREDDMTWRC